MDEDFDNDVDRDPDYEPLYEDEVHIDCLWLEHIRFFVISPIELFCE